MSSINLYQIPQVIQTTQAGAVGVQSPTNKIDFDISKNVTTEIDFLLRNIDRKLIIDSTIVLIIHIIDQYDQSLKLQRTLAPINAGRGHYRLIIDPADIINWRTGYYSYSVVVERSNQTQVLVHSDQNRTQYGFLELKAGPIPPPKPPITLLPADFFHRFGGSPIVEYLESGAQKGAAQTDNRNGVHTCAVYSKNFTGVIRVQASLDNSAPSAEGAWFDVQDTLITLDASTGVSAISFVGSFMWVRIIQLPSPTNSGTVTKILLKN